MKSRALAKEDPRDQIYNAPRGQELKSTKERQEADRQKRDVEERAKPEGRGGREDRAQDPGRKGAVARVPERAITIIEFADYQCPVATAKTSGR